MKMGLSVASPSEKDLGWCSMFQEREGRMYEVCKKEFFLIFVKLSIYDVFIEFRSKNIYTCRIHSMYMRTKEFFCAKGYFVIFSTRFFFSFFNFLCKYTRHILYKHLYQGHHQISI